jgi:hypothetical protein
MRSSAASSDAELSRCKCPVRPLRPAILLIERGDDASGVHARALLPFWPTAGADRLLGPVAAKGQVGAKCRGSVHDETAAQCVGVGSGAQDTTFRRDRLAPPKSPANRRCSWAPISRALSGIGGGWLAVPAGAFRGVNKTNRQTISPVNSGELKAQEKTSGPAGRNGRMRHGEHASDRPCPDMQQRQIF